MCLAIARAIAKRRIGIDEGDLQPRSDVDSRNSQRAIRRTRSQALPES